ncbi:MAG: phytoene/squalene synthase family protein [Hyphomicrobiales bacterium]|nr:phytoene/squalene synthase family protein [Hyphomicrobiales bacterium]
MSRAQAAATDAPDDRVIAEVVRNFDRNRYWSALFAPEPIRAHLLALYAYNVELSRIPEQVNEAMFGEVRLQWWRDALDPLNEDGPTGHPVADALMRTRAAFDIPHAALIDMAEARLFDLGREMTPDAPTLDAYLQRTAGAIFRLGCRIAGVEAERAEPACAAAARAYGLTGLLRALPYHAARGRLFLPADHFAAHGVDPYALLRGEARPELHRALTYLRADARRHLQDARASLRGISPASLTVFLPLALIEPYLDRLARPERRPLLDIVELNPAARLWRIARAHYKGAV